MFCFNFLKKKRNIIIFLIVFLSVFIASNQILQINKSNKIKINSCKNVVFWTLQLGSFDKYINNIISEYENTHENIKIKWVDIPYSEGEKRTLAAILTDNPPDLVNLTPDFSLLLAQKNALYNIPDEYMKSYLPELTEILKYDDKYFGIPFYATSAVTLYNTNLTNSEPKTYDDLFSYPSQNGTFLTMINFTENDTLLKILNKYGINSSNTINNEESRRLFTEFKRLYDNNLIPKESVTQTHRDALEKYMSGQIAFIVTGANFINMIKENAPGIYSNTKILPQLTGSSGLYDYSLMNFIIPKKAKNKKEAVEFALFFTNKINQLELAKMTPILPSNKDALNDDYFKLYTNSDLQAQARIISAKQLKNLQPPLKNIKNKKELNTLTSSYIQEILINNVPVQDALDEFALSWEKL